MTAPAILNGWREVENFSVPSAATHLSRNVVERLISLDFLCPLTRGPAGQIRISADDLDAAWRAREEARSLARDRFGNRRVGGRERGAQ